MSEQSAEASSAPRVVAILQPGYLPWLGFFEQMARADIFVHYDDVQYTRKDWRNRNRVKDNNVAQWLTVPVRKAPIETLIRDIRVDNDAPWATKHLKTLRHGYQKAPHFDPLFSALEAVLTRRHEFLWELNVEITDVLARSLAIDTPTAFASAVPRTVDDRSLRIIEVCRHFGADILYDGKAAADFIDTDLFRSHGVEVVFQDYEHPEYAQIGQPFISHLSAVDLVFNTGPGAGAILRQPPCALPPRDDGH